MFRSSARRTSRSESASSYASGLSTYVGTPASSSRVDDLGVRGGGRVHEGGVEALGEQRVEVGVPLPGGEVQAVGDPGERGGCPRLQVQFEPRAGWRAPADTPSARCRRVRCSRPSRGLLQRLPAGVCRKHTGAGKRMAGAVAMDDHACMTNIRSAPNPPSPPTSATMLEGWLDYHRETLAWKCEGLDDAQLRTASVPPSELSLLGLVRHMAEVERSWFRRGAGGRRPGADLLHRGGPGRRVPPHRGGHLGGGVRHLAGGDRASPGATPRASPWTTLCRPAAGSPASRSACAGSTPT